MADDLAGPAFFLVCPDIDFMTGQTLLVDGGLNFNQRLHVECDRAMSMSDSLVDTNLGEPVGRDKGLIRIT